MDHLVELLQKKRAVALAERRRALGDFTHVAKLREQLPRCQRRADVFFREWLSGRAENTGTLSYASACKRDVGGDDDIILACPPGDPVISSIESARYDLKMDECIVRYAHPRICNQYYRKTVALRHAVYFVFYRAGIGINKDMQHSITVYKITVSTEESRQSLTMSSASWPVLFNWSAPLAF